jgi:universal stress protein A
MFDKILAAIDLDEESANVVLDKLKDLAKGEVWVIHAVEPQYVQYSIDPTFTGSLTRAMEEDAIKAAKSRLAEVCASRGIAEDHQLVSIGRAANQIHDAATELGVDTILIGSHARKGLGRLLGSTANAVLHGSPVNVMTIRVPE